jgi:hypothetical protein
MPFPTKDNLLHLGLAWPLVNELENQLTSPNFTQLFGGSIPTSPMGAMNESGNIYRIIGNPVAGNAADTTDDILAGFVLQPGAFDGAGRGLAISAQGKTGATTNNKRIRLFINPTMTGHTIANGVISGGSVTAGTPTVDTGNWQNATTPNNAVGWAVSVNLFKYGPPGSNTQYAQGGYIENTLHGGIQLPQFLTLPENAAINIVVTGASLTSAVANDVILNFLEVTGMN